MTYPTRFRNEPAASKVVSVADSGQRSLASDAPGSDALSSIAADMGGPQLGRPPADLVAETFDVGGEPFVVLSYTIVEDERPSGLTVAEYGVVRLILEGLSNAEIARARGSSPRTVANQIAAVFRKLGVRSRAELAAKLMRDVFGTS
jgi:DNA-binding CsgD family transcriptional regulator